jgi:hypothetical protein
VKRTVITTTCYHAETEVAPLRTAVVEIFGNDAARIKERCLRRPERDPVLGAIRAVLGVVPFEVRLARNIYV